MNTVHLDGATAVHKRCNEASRVNSTKTIKLTRAQAIRIGMKSAIKWESVGPIVVKSNGGYDKYRTKRINL